MEFRGKLFRHPSQDRQRPISSDSLMNKTFSYRNKRRVERELNYSITYTFKPLINQKSRDLLITPIQDRRGRDDTMSPPPEPKKLTSSELSEFLKRNYSLPLKWKKERLETAKPPPEDEPLGPEFTFKPEISETSKELAGSNVKTMYERAVKDLEAKKVKILESKQAGEEKVLKKCTFRPNIKRSNPKFPSHITQAKPVQNSYSKLYHAKKLK